MTGPGVLTHRILEGRRWEELVMRKDPGWQWAGPAAHLAE